METSLKGKLLVAMPGLIEPTFHQSVIFMCAHSNEGAMGLIINKPIAGMSFFELADRLDLSGLTDTAREALHTKAVHMGGPVEQQRGFVLHETSYGESDGSLTVNDRYMLTATLDVLQDMARGKGPRQTLLALGYSSWAPGQLENEILHNGWLHCDDDPAIVFGEDNAAKYQLAMQRLGIDPRMLSTDAGHG